MPLWTSCLGRDCLVLELGQRLKPGGPVSLAQRGPCRNGVKGECTGRRPWSVFGLERKADDAISNAHNTIE